MSSAKNKTGIKNSSTQPYFILLTWIPSFSILKMVSNPSITKENNNGDIEHPYFIPILVLIIGLN